MDPRNKSGGGERVELAPIGLRRDERNLLELIETDHFML